MPLFQTPDDRLSEREIVEYLARGHRDAIIEKVTTPDGRDTARCDYRVDLPSLGRRFLVEAKDRHGPLYTLRWLTENGIKVDRKKVEALVRRARAEGRTPLLVFRTFDLGLVIFHAEEALRAGQHSTMLRTDHGKERGETVDQTLTIPVSVARRALPGPCFEEAAKARASRGDMRLLARAVFGDMGGRPEGKGDLPPTQRGG